jgi:hypothetical protein
MLPARGEKSVTSVPRSRCCSSCPFSIVSRISSSLIRSSSVNGLPALAICRSRQSNSCCGAVV